MAAWLLSIHYPVRQAGSQPVRQLYYTARMLQSDERRLLRLYVKNYINHPGTNVVRFGNKFIPDGDDDNRNDALAITPSQRVAEKSSYKSFKKAI